MGRLVVAFFLISIVASNVGANEDMVGQDWLLVTTPALRDAFEPLVELRREQGYRVSVVDDWQSDTTDDIDLAKRISGRIKESCETAGQTFVLIGGSYRPTDGESFVPTTNMQVVADIENSKFAKPDQDFADQAIDVLTSGSVFTVYCGHSSASGLWSKSRYVVSRDGFANLKSEGYPGVFLSCGCFTCQIDERPKLSQQVNRADGESAAGTAASQGFGLAAIQNPNGPAAVVGPYGESYAAFGVFR